MSNPQKTMTPEQQKMFNEIQGKSKEEQCQMIADACNKAGITKEQLKQILKAK